MKFFRFQFLLTIFIASTILISACAVPDQEKTIKLAPMKEMPITVQQSPTSVQESYQFAVANPDILKEIPCYCGCGPMGHTSNYSCYVQSGNTNGVTFDEHALGCSICVDITTDTMHMLKEGQSIKEIRATIDQRYSQFGPSNMAPVAP